MSLADAWESNAAEWISWARAPDLDAFWAGTWPELSAVLPAPDGLTIDLGCGEGRATRKLATAGHRVLGVERSATLARAARAGSSSVTVVRADAAAVPLRDGAATLVVACMVLHDVDDLSAVSSEIARILRPGGNVCVSMVHPFASARDPAALHTHEMAIIEPYSRERRFEDRIERNGLAVTIGSMHRPLSAYVDALTSAGLAITAMREFGDRSIPWLLTFRATKMTGARR